jgi:hypothetical protein
MQHNNQREKILESKEFYYQEYQQAQNTTANTNPEAINSNKCP